MVRGQTALAMRQVGFGHRFVPIRNDFAKIRNKSAKIRNNPPYIRNAKAVFPGKFVTTWPKFVKLPDRLLIQPRAAFAWPTVISLRVRTYSQFRQTTSVLAQLLHYHKAVDLWQWNPPRAAFGVVRKLTTPEELTIYW